MHKAMEYGVDVKMITGTPLLHRDYKLFYRIPSIVSATCGLLLICCVQALLMHGCVCCSYFFAIQVTTC